MNLQAQTLEWVATPFSRGSCPPGIEVSRIAGRFFMNWAPREEQNIIPEDI